MSLLLPAEIKRVNRAIFCVVKLFFVRQNLAKFV